VSVQVEQLDEISEIIASSVFYLHIYIRTAVMTDQATWMVITQQLTKQFDMSASNPSGVINLN
jgi:hypothetical protein